MMTLKRINLLVLIAFAISSSYALANPNGAKVIKGKAKFSQPNANTLKIKTGRKTVIDWQSFSIGAGQTTKFVQRNRNSAVLNRVTGNSPSKIFGNLKSNGKVFLINQHGMMIGNSARINTAGFYGSTLNITNEDFLRGRLKFEGGGLGGIVNHGYIHAGPGGNVVLIAPDIENGGVIKVEGGQVVLAAGESIRLTSLNDSSIEFDVTSKDDNSLINLGSIVARQGAVRLFAGNLQHSGSINATGIVRNADGSVSLVANTSASITGDIAAGGRRGGRIVIEAESIDIGGTAAIRASGPHGGGQILIGGDRQGLNPEIRNASSTTLGENASVRADATRNGDGGKVVLFASEDVHVHGEISAIGGDRAGDGGFIETSGLEVLDITRAPDASAANGAAGEWLIDPNNITIVAGAGAGDPNDYLSQFTASVDSTVLGSALINSSLDSGTSVSIATGAGGAEAGDITVLDAIVKSAGVDTSITLSAHNDINIDQDIRASSGRLDIILDANSDDVGGGEISINATLDGNGGSIDASNETVTVNLDDATINSDMAVGSLNLQQGTLGGSGNITVSGLTRWNPAGSDPGAQDVFLLGSGVLVADGGFDLGTNLDNDTLTLDKTLVVNAFSNWSDANANSNNIIGSGSIINNDEILIGVSTDLTVAPAFLNNGLVTSAPLNDGIITFTSSLFSMNQGAELDVVNGTFALPNTPLILSNAAELNGGGIFDGDVFSLDGIIDIENASGGPGTLSITGDLTLGPEATVVFDLGGNLQGSGYDFLDVGGDVILDGTLVLFWDNDFTAADFDTFELIESATSISGDFINQIDPAGLLSSTTNLNDPQIFQLVTATVAPNIIFWTQETNGVWSNAGNWSAGVPGLGDYAVIDADNETLLVTIDTAVTIAGLTSENNISISDVNGALNLGGDGLVSASLIVDSANGLSVDGNLTIAGGFDWRQGDLDGSGSIDIYSVGAIAIGNTAGNLNLALVNNSLQGSTWTGGAAGGTGNIFNSGFLQIDGSFASALTINNNFDGGLAKTDNSTTSLNGLVTNNGTILVEQGKLTLGSSATHSGIFDVSAGATLEFIGSHSSLGTISGDGTIDLLLAPGFTSLGFIQPGGAGSIGSLAFLGDLNNTGFIQIDIENGGGSPTPGIDYDQVTISGNADLQGTMNLTSVNGYVVSGSDNFVPVTYATSSSNSLTINAIGGESVIPNYNANDLTLQLNLSLISWDDGGAAGNWFDPLNWSGDVLPGLLDDVQITLGSAINFNGNVTINSLFTDQDFNINGGTLTITSSGQFDGALSLAGGNLAGDGAIVANGNFNWSTGSLQGSGLFTSNATSALAGGNRTLARNWLNNATLNWQNGNIALNSNATLTNLGSVNVNAAGGSMTLGSGTTFDNQAVLNVNADAAINGGGSFNSSGSIAISSGVTLTTTNTGGSDTGTLSIGPGGIFALLGGSRTLNDGFNVSSSGTLNISGGTLNVETSSALILPVGLGVNLSAGSLQGGGDLVVNDALNWTGGSLAGSGLLTTNAVTTLNTSALTISRNWTNSASGTVNWNAANLGINSNRSFTNAGTVNASASANLSLSSGTTFNNQNSLLVDSNSSISGGGNFTNSGNITILGASNLTTSNTAGIDTGSWNIGAGSAFIILGGSRSLNDGFSLGSSSGTLSVSGGTLNVDTTSPLALPASLNVALAAGFLQGTGDVVINGAFGWTGGAISGSGLLTTNGVSTLNSGSLTISRNWTNSVSGVINWDAGNLAINSNRSFTNAGDFTANAAANFSLSSGTTFDNQNTFHVDSDSSITGGGSFHNTGSISILAASSLTVSNTAGVDTGSWDIGSGGRFDLLGGSRTLNDGFSVTSTGGVVGIVGGVLDVNTSSALILPVGLGVELSAGSLQGAGDVELLGAFLWTGGSIAGSGLLTTHATTSLNSSGVTLSRNWVNAAGGVVNWTSGNMGINTSRSLTNLGVFNADAGANLSLGSGTVVDNQNSIIVGSAVTISGAGSFDNSGSITIDPGASLTLSNGAGNDTGSWDIGAGGVFALLGGTRTLNDGFSVSSSGKLAITGGTLNADTTSTLMLPAGLDVDLITGLLQGTGDIDINGAFNWSGGSIAGTGLLITRGITTLSPGSVTIARDWTNAASGTVNWNAGNLAINSNSSFINAGTFNASAGANFSTSSGTFIENQGDFILASNTSITGAGSFQQSFGQIDLNGFDLTIPVGLGIDDGFLTGSGSVIGDVLNIAGIIQPGGFGTIGSLTIDGDLIQSSDATLEIEVESPTAAGVSYDLLDVTGQLTADGGLLLISEAGYVPLNADSITPVNYSSLVGSFSIASIGVASASPDYTVPNLDILFTVAGGLISWDGGGNGIDWTDPLNWDGDLLPLIGDDVAIGNFSVTVAGAADANTLSLASGGTLLVSDGPFNLADDSVLAGDLTIDGLFAVMNVGGSLSIGGTLTLSQGSLNTVGDLNVTGATNWASSGGAGNELVTLGGAGVFNANGGFNVAAFGDSLALNKALSINLGSSWATVGAGTSQISGSGSISSTAAISIDLPAAALQVAVPFNNTVSASLTRNSGSEGLEFTAGFNNDGVVQINPGTGTLRLSGDGTHSGSFLVDDVLELSGASTHDFTASSAIDGSGDVLVSDADVTLDTFDDFDPTLSIDSPSSVDSVSDLTFNSDVFIDGFASFDTLAQAAGTTITLDGNSLSIANDSTLDGNLDIFAGDLILGGVLTINDTLNWSPSGNSTISGGGSGGLVVAGTLNVLGNNFHAFSNIVVDNFGVTNYLATGGVTALRLNDGTVFNNNGLFDLQNNLIVGNTSGAGSFNNIAGGELRKSAGTGLATIVAGIGFTNSSATINIQSGSLSVNGGASLTLDSTSVLEGFGTYIGALVNEGTIRPGGALTPGILSINGDFTNNGFIEIEIDDPAGGPGSGYDQLAVIGGNNADLSGGTLDLIAINGYTVSNGDSLQPLTFGSSNGNSLLFSPVVDEGVAPSYNGTSLDLLLTLAGAPVFWDGGGADLFWNSALNWSGDLVPTLADDVSLGAFNVIVAADADANSLTLDSGFELTIIGGTLSLAADTVMDGNLTLDGGNLLAAGTLDIGGAVNLIAGGLASVGNTTVNGKTTWNSASSVTLGGAGNFAAIGGFDLGALLDSAVLTLNRNLFIGGVSSWADAGDVANTINGSGSITNSGNISAINNSDLNINLVFANNGDLVKSAGTGELAFNNSFTNAGNVSLQAATTSFGLGLVQSAGLTLLNGGAMSGNLILNGGQFGGNGTLSGNLNHNAGGVGPGGQGVIGTLTIDGNYVQGPAANLVIEIAGNGGGSAVGGVDFDNLVVTGNTSLAGNLVLLPNSGYAVSNDDSFNIITTSGVTSGAFGGFSAINGEELAEALIGPDYRITLSFGSLFSFTGSGDGFTWNDPLNWNQGLPGLSSEVSVGNFNVTIDGFAVAETLSLASGGNLTIDTGGTLTITQDSNLNGLLTLAGGDLDVTGTVLTLAGGFDWSGASTVTGGGSGEVNLPGVTAISGAGGHVLSSVTVNNSGTVNYSSGSLELQNSSGAALFNNGGVFNFAGDLNIADNTGGGFSGFHNLNNGTIVKSAGSGTATIAGSLASSNKGNVRILTGSFDGGLASWTLGNGDVLSGFGSYVGDVVNNGGVVRAGSSSTAGTLTVVGNYVHDAGSISMQQGSDALIVNDMTVNGSLGLSNGSMTANNIATIAGSSLNIAGGSLIANGAAQITGAFNMSSGRLQLNSGGTLFKKNNTWSGGTIAGAAPLVLGSVGGDTTLVLSGPAEKRLEAITIDMNLNDIIVDQNASGDLRLVSGAVIDNTGGQSFKHGGSGDIVGNGSFINNGGLFANLAGDTAIGANVNFINDSSSVVRVAGGSLTLLRAEASDPATYNVETGATLKLGANRNFVQALNSQGTIQLAKDVIATLPVAANIKGDVLLNEAVLDLNGNLLKLDGSTLSGSGTVFGDVFNSNGVLVVGGPNNIGNLLIDGNYTQNNGAALVVDVFNNGLNTRSDLLTVSGKTTLNGGVLLIGFTSNSLGLVTADFSPFDFQGGVSGNFSSVFDARGDILLVSFLDGVFTVLGSTPAVPDTVVDDLVSFLDNSDELAESVASNLSEAEATTEELQETEEEQGNLVCN